MEGGSFALPEPGDAPSASTAATLAALVEDRRNKAKACVGQALAAFDANLAAGTITVASHKDLENVSVHWLPPEGWTAASGGVVKGLAAKTQMSASWNGCPECPIVLRPFVKPPPPKKVPVEQVAAALRGMGAVFGKEVAPEDLNTAATLLAGVGDLYASYLGGFQAVGAYRGIGGGACPEQEPCPHQQHHTPVFRRPCVSYAAQAY